MSKDTNPALAEHTVPDAPAAPVSQAVQTIPPAQAAVEIPQFASPTQEARYHILQYLTKNRGIPQRCSAIVQAVRERNASISRNAIDTALYELTSRRQLLIKISRGVYQLNTVTASNDTPQEFMQLSAPAAEATSALDALEMALSCINSFQITVKIADIDEIFLRKYQILIDTKQFLLTQMDEINNLDSGTKEPDNRVRPTQNVHEVKHDGQKSIDKTS